MPASCVYQCVSDRSIFKTSCKTCLCQIKRSPWHPACLIENDLVNIFLANFSDKFNMKFQKTLYVSFSFLREQSWCKFSGNTFLFNGKFCTKEQGKGFKQLFFHLANFANKNPGQILQPVFFQWQILRENSRARTSNIYLFQGHFCKQTSGTQNYFFNGLKKSGVETSKHNRILANL